MSFLYFSVNNTVWQSVWVVILIIVCVCLFLKKVNLKFRFLLQLLVVLFLGFILSVNFSPMHIFSCAAVGFCLDGFSVLKVSWSNMWLIILAMVLANKSVCGWCCHFGALQELCFFNKKTKKYKIPFVVTNTIRTGFFLLLIVLALFWGIDIVSEIDPFYVFSPGFITVAGGITVLIVLGLSFFIYRPWCHLFCPFGLIGWLLEKIAIFKIRVDYNKCIKCDACVKACPTQAMAAILNKSRMIPDCSLCGRCLSVCPVAAIAFKLSKEQ